MTLHESLPCDQLPTTCPVLIAGGGPSGLMMALDLAQRGIETVVVEPRTTVDTFRPRAKTTNARTMTLLRRLGLADRLRAASPLDLDYSQDVVFCTGVAGHELRRFTHAFQLYADGYDLAPEPGQQCPQPTVEQVLRDAVAESGLARLYTGIEVVSATNPDEPVVEVSDGTSSATIRPDWLVGADGGSSRVRKSLGIRLEGSSAPRPNFNVVFRSRELADRVTLGHAVQYWTIGEVSGMLGQLDLDDLWWVIAQGVHPDQCTDPERLVRRLAGADFDVEVIATDPWTARMLLAPRYGVGHAFLVGDAAHLNPPWGGHGFNTCVVDALNLSWKLAAVIDGWGGIDLLDSYQTERRPVAQWMIEIAASNGKALAYDFVDEALDRDDEQGAAARARAHEALTVKDPEFHSEGLVLGYRYDDSPLLSPDGTPAPALDPVIYTPTARPGALLPHLWLADGRSVYDLLGSDFTLLTTEGSTPPPTTAACPCGWYGWRLPTPTEQACCGAPDTSSCARTSTSPGAVTTLRNFPTRWPAPRDTRSATLLPELLSHPRALSS